MVKQISNMKEFQTIIMDDVKSTFPHLKTMGTSMRITRAIQTPAMFVELNEFEQGEQPNQLECLFSIRLLESTSSYDNSSNLEDLAIKISKYINGNRFSVNAEPARVFSARADNFSGLEDGYNAFEISFRQTITLGQDLCPAD